MGFSPSFPSYGLQCVLHILEKFDALKENKKFCYNKEKE